jgi:nucleotide-binding universal stress UspA family protein
MNGEARWLTVPVLQRSQKECIVEKQIDQSLADTPRWWSMAHFQTIRQAYREARFIGEYAPALRRIFETRWPRLVELNAAMLEFLRDAYDIRTKVVRSSELSPRGAKSELILNLCREVGADTLLVGSRRLARLPRQGGVRAPRRCPRIPAIHSPRLRAVRRRALHSGLSSLDMLLNCGADSRRLLLGEAKQEARVAA